MYRAARWAKEVVEALLTKYQRAFKNFERQHFPIREFYCKSWRRKLLRTATKARCYACAEIQRILYLNVTEVYHEREDDGRQQIQCEMVRSQSNRNSKETLIRAENLGFNPTGYLTLAMARINSLWSTLKVNLPSKIVIKLKGNKFYNK